MLECWQNGEIEVYLLSYWKKSIIDNRNNWNVALYIVSIYCQHIHLPKSIWLETNSTTFEQFLPSINLIVAEKQRPTIRDRFIIEN